MKKKPAKSHPWRARRHPKTEAEEPAAEPTGDDEPEQPAAARAYVKAEVACDRVLEALGDGPLPVNEIAQRTGLNLGQIYRAIEKLGKRIARESRTGNGDGQTFRIAA